MGVRFSSLAPFFISMNTNISPMVSIQNITKKYHLSKRKANSSNYEDDKSNFYALRDVSCDIYEHDRIALIGPNGSGKTTLSHIISNVIKPSSGTINYSFNNGSAISKNIGIQFQENIYPYNITVKDLINFYKRIYSKKINLDDLNNFIDVFKIKPLLKRRISHLSGGQKQLVNILVATIHKPQLLILDEISTGLDISKQEEISFFIKNLVERYKLTLLLVSHNLLEINALVSKIWFLQNGQLKTNDSVENIKKDHESIQKFLYKSLHQKPKEKDLVISE